jgi:hypothetical protein
MPTHGGRSRFRAQRPNLVGTRFIAEPAGGSRDDTRVLVVKRQGQGPRRAPRAGDRGQRLKRAHSATPGFNRILGVGTGVTRPGQPGQGQSNPRVTTESRVGQGACGPHRPLPSVWVGAEVFGRPPVLWRAHRQTRSRIPSVASSSSQTLRSLYKGEDYHIRSARQVKSRSLRLFFTFLPFDAFRAPAVTVKAARQVPPPTWAVPFAR